MYQMNDVERKFKVAGNGSTQGSTLKLHLSAGYMQMDIGSEYQLSAHIITNI